MDASPGVPYASIASTNEKLIQNYGKHRLIADVNKRMSLLSRKDWTFDPVSNVRNGLSDPVRMFVKNEPHKIEKLREGRVRLIHSVSIVDKLIELVLFKALLIKEISNWNNIPSKPGMGFTEEDVSSIIESVKTMRKPKESDVSGWDFGVSDWEMIDDTENIIKLCLNPTELWKTLVRNKTICETMAVFQFSDGEMVVADYAGIVNSGKLRTSSSNSRMRVRAAYMIGAEEAIAAGDDCVEDEVEDAIAKYLVLGHKIKQYEDAVDGFEFCSHKYFEKGIVSTNVRKLIMNLLHNKPKNEIETRLYILGFWNELGTHPEWDKIYSDILEAGFG
jgi:hypothetical protein